MSKKRFASVWDAIEPTEAENMKLRAKLMRAIISPIARAGMSQR